MLNVLLFVCIVFSDIIEFVYFNYLNCVKSEHIKMFSFKENECVGFESQWRVKKVSTQSATQTTEYCTAENDTNTVFTNEIETQTDDNEERKSCDIDMEKLSEFLKRIYPALAKDMEENLESQAFANYRITSVEIDAKSKLLQTIAVTKQKGEGDGAYYISALSWNCTGNTLAVACAQNHKTWCHHTGFVKLYTFDSNDCLPEVPRLNLTKDACVSVLAFHPTLPYILAGGTFSGEIIIWTVQSDVEIDCLFATVAGHRENVTGIHWIHDKDSNKSVILGSSSLDGTINLWNFNLSSNVFDIKLKYKVKPPVLARIQRQSAIPAETLNKVDRGIICFDFSKHVTDMFVVGIEGGLVVQCSMLGASQLKSDKDIQVFDPVFKYYQPHEGEILEVSFSMNRKDMFLSSGSDGEIRIYIIAEDEPGQVLFLNNSLKTVSWVPHFEKLLCGCGDNGSIEIFNIAQGRKLLDVYKENEVDKKPITRMVLNLRRLSTLAIGNNSAEIELWNIPWSTM